MHPLSLLNKNVYCVRVMVLLFPQRYLLMLCVCVCVCVWLQVSLDTRYEVKD